MEKTEKTGKKGQKGTITGVAGVVVTAKTDSYVRMFEKVWVGGALREARLLGEVVRIREKEADIQIYGDTTRLAVGEEVSFTGELLSVDLGPGFLGEILNGVGQFLRVAPWAKNPEPEKKNELEKKGIYLKQGQSLPDALQETASNERLWHFTPSVTEGDALVSGDVVGTVVEGKQFLHRILVPPIFSPSSFSPSSSFSSSFSSRETVAWIAPEGDYVSRECICRLASGAELTLTQRWEVRVPRPVKARLPLDRPLLTGRRAVDTLFPLALGGVAAISGGAGTGKTVLQRCLVRWCNADVFVRIGCGERGSEVAEAFEEFSEIERQGIPLRERTVFIANTANMPIAARETSVYWGVTLAEYYRDMGYNAVVMVDSMSRWTEALREIEGRLGYSACLSSRLSGYCERGGQVETLGTFSRRGSVSLINGLSPEGEGLSEPQELALFGACWRLDKALAQSHHFPAVSLESYSLYEETISDAMTHEAGQDWPKLKEYLRTVLLRERELSGLAVMLSEEEQWLLFHAETLKAVYLQQDAFDVKSVCPSLESLAAMLRLLKALDDTVRKFLREGLRCHDVIHVRASMRTELIAMWPLMTDTGEWLELFSAELAERAKLAQLTAGSVDGEATQ